MLLALHSLLAAALLLLPIEAAALLVFDPTMGVVSAFDGDNGPQNEISPIDAQVTVDGFTVTGDFQSSAPTLQAERLFTVGPLPVEITITLDEDAKVVLANGGLATPVVDYVVEASIFDLSGGGGLLTGVSLPALQFVGNGFDVTTRTAQSISYVLAPGDYVIFFQVQVSPDDLSDGSRILEYGGVSGFDGYAVSIASQVVPEPGTALLIGAGLLGLAGAGRPRH